MTTADDPQWGRDAQYQALSALCAKSVCGTCDSYPRVAWIQGEWRIRCDCYPKPPELASAFKRETRGRT